MIGQLSASTLDLETRLLALSLVESNRAPAVCGESRCGGLEVARGRDELTPSKAVQTDILLMPIEPTHQNKEHQK